MKNAVGDWEIAKRQSALGLRPIRNEFIRLSPRTCA